MPSQTPVIVIDEANPKPKQVSTTKNMEAISQIVFLRWVGSLLTDEFIVTFLLTYVVLAPNGVRYPRWGGRRDAVRVEK